MICGKKLSVSLLALLLALSPLVGQSSSLSEAKEIIKAQSQMIESLTQALIERDKQLTAKDQQLTKLSELLETIKSENLTLKTELQTQLDYWQKQKLYVSGLESSLKEKQTENTLLWIASGLLAGGLSLDLLFRR